MVTPVSPPSLAQHPHVPSWKGSEKGREIVEETVQCCPPGQVN